jgi:pSer/pThr/pTyr-binding forkhead associated (FHA) protein
MGIRVSFQVIEGVDKGRAFFNLEAPVTIGREEGNVIRLNDDRISRFHAKIQEDQGELVLTDLDSTNGTRVNGESVQLRLLRVGDRITLGRSTIVYGTLQDIKTRLRASHDDEESVEQTEGAGDVIDIQTNLHEESFDMGSEGPVDVFTTDPPPLPRRLSPAQAALLAEVVDFLHRGLADAISGVHIPPGASEARLSLSSWQRVQALLVILSQYSRDISEPRTDAGS